MRRTVVTALLVAAACRGGTSRSAIDEPPDAMPVYQVVRPAIRCAECHASMHSEWAASAHAASDRAPLYRAMAKRADPALRCARCHAPLAGLVDPKELVAHEGVTCEVCHSIDSVGENGTFSMALAENRQRGTICDARDHNFHKMGCSPLHGESRFCASCHTLVIGALKVFTDVDDWKHSPYNDMLDCQGCHMPDRTAEVAAGSPPREDVSHHGFRGMDDRLFGRALTGRVAVRKDGGVLHVDITVKNANAGHRVPGGLPGRQMILRVRALGASGETLATAERVYERVLVDRRREPVPFFLATAEQSDNRLKPREERVEQLELEAPAARRVRVEVVRRSIAPGLAAAVGRPPPEELVLARAEVAPGSVAVEWHP